MVGETPGDRLKRARIDAGYKSARAFQMQNDLTSTYPGHENGTRGITRAMAEIYAELLGVSARWIMFGGDNDDGKEDLPVYASAQGGPGQVLLMDSEPIEYSQRPIVLHNLPEAFGLVLTGDSMEPAYRPGDTLMVAVGEPVQRSDDVLIVLNDRKAGQKVAMVKLILAQKPDELHLYQHNPPPGQDSHFSIPTKDVEMIAPVVGVLRSR
ncbi:MAG: hypothetical protein Alpg2KO_01310 [Alphaproteobacteria bacterium]